MLKAIYLFAGILMVVGSVMSIYGAITGKPWMLRGKAEDLPGGPHGTRRRMVWNVVLLIIGITFVILAVTMA